MWISFFYWKCFACPWKIPFALRDNNSETTETEQQCNVVGAYQDATKIVKRFKKEIKINFVAVFRADIRGMPMLWTVIANNWLSISLEHSTTSPRRCQRIAQFCWKFDDIEKEKWNASRTKTITPGKWIMMEVCMPTPKSYVGRGRVCWRWWS